MSTIREKWRRLDLTGKVVMAVFMLVWLPVAVVVLPVALAVEGVVALAEKP